MKKGGKPKPSSNPTAAMIVIGDEILSGRTLDLNTNTLAKKLTHIGVQLLQVRIVADLKEDIIESVNSLRTNHTYIFTSGGIGPTHDDITADSIAGAFGVTIDVRDDAKKLLATNYKNGEKDLNEARLKMARIPEGAILIDNPISKAPGFCIENVYVMAGIPQIFNVMLDSILPSLSGGDPLISVNVKLSYPEGEIAECLKKLADEYSDVSIGSYPFYKDGFYGTNIVLRHRSRVVLDKVEVALKESMFKKYKG